MTLTMAENIRDNYDAEVEFVGVSLKHDGIDKQDGTEKMAHLPVPSVSDRRDGKTLVLEQFQYFVCY